jgi:transcriptional antiterminator RfaH
MMHWYALHCKPHKEQVVFEQLLVRSIEAFYPCILSRNNSRRKTKKKAYFPGYIFVHADLEQLGTSSLQWLPGVINIVAFGGIPARVPKSLINTLRSKIERINNADKDIVERIKPGDKVEISGGLFDGHKAIFDSRLPGGERARVLLALLNHQMIQIQLPTAQLHS